MGKIVGRLLAVQHGFDEQLAEPLHRQAATGQRAGKDADLAAVVRALDQRLVQIVGMLAAALGQVLILHGGKVTETGHHQRDLDDLGKRDTLGRCRLLQFADGAWLVVREQVEHGTVDILLHRHFTLRASRLESDACPRSDQCHTFGPDQLQLLRQRECARSLDPVVLAELLVDQEITRRLGQLAVGNLSE